MIRPGALVIVHLVNPTEKFWGMLQELGVAGVMLRGINLSSFDDWMAQATRPGDQTLGLSTMFVPLFRVERIFLDEPVGEVESYRQRFEPAGRDARRALPRDARRGRRRGVLRSAVLKREEHGGTRTDGTSTDSHGQHDPPVRAGLCSSVFVPVSSPRTARSSRRTRRLRPSWRPARSPSPASARTGRRARGSAWSAGRRRRPPGRGRSRGSGAGRRPRC